MALHRALQETASAEFTVTASAPMAGPYDLSGTTFAMALTDPSESSSLYAAYLLVAYDAIYDVYSSPAEAFVAPTDGCRPRRRRCCDRSTLRRWPPIPTIPLRWHCGTMTCIIGGPWLRCVSSTVEQTRLCHSPIPRSPMIICRHWVQTLHFSMSELVLTTAQPSSRASWARNNGWTACGTERSDV